MGDGLCYFLCWALLWISLLLSSWTEALPESEKRALLGLKEILQQEGGTAAFLSEWGGETDFCNLQRQEETKTASSEEGTVNVGCEDGYVTRIEMIGGGGSGRVSSEALALHLTNFTKLTDLRLISLGIGGPLSSKFGRLSNLQSLNLSSNSISGSLPSRLLDLRSLRILAIDDNLLNTTFPQRWHSNSLHTNNNNLSILSLSHNQIHGTFPPDLFSSLPRLTSLHLDANLISGPLPPSVSSAVSLLSLSLSGNQISGTLPDLPPHLLLLSLANNRLHGNLPTSFARLSNLQFLDLSGNLLAGFPPPDLFSLPSLVSFNVARNRLSGSFSANLKLSSALKSMDFSFNLMTGNLPDAMVRSLLSKRAEIRFQGNCLSTDLQPQHPFAYCQNAALASGLASDLSKSVEKHRKVHSATVAAIAVAIAIAAVIVVVFMVLFVVHKRRSRSHGDIVPVKYLRGGGGDDGRKRPCMGQKSVDVSSEMLSNARYISRTMKLGGLGFPQFRVFSMDELYRATDYFHESTLIGQGSHGKVYKGQLDDGTLIAIKRLGSKEGGVESQADAWKARVERLGKCRHKHVVALLGYNMMMVEADESEEESGGSHGGYGRNHRERRIQMSLVYEYVGDRTLSKKLAGKRLEGLGWVHRLKVIIGAAKGVHFLHFGSVPGIFNNDISTTNILLDQNWVPKISDFGLSLRQPSNSISLPSPQAPSKSSKRSYIDDSKTRKGVDDKDDIYSFGLVLLEVLTGRPPSSSVHGSLTPKELESLVGVGYGSRVECIDPRIAGVCNMESLETVIDITIKCLCEDPMGRPSMEDVLWNLQYALQVQSSSASFGGSHEDLADGLCVDGPKTELLFPSRSRRKNMANIERIYSEELAKPSSPNTDFFR